MANSLNVSQSQVNRVLGVSLAQIYQTLLAAPLPERLQALVDQLEMVLAAQDRSDGEDEDRDGPERL